MQERRKTKKNPLGKKEIKKRKIQEKGITLIALVITIIILLMQLELFLFHFFYFA